MKRIVPPVKGTRDFYPEQMALRTWLYGVMRQVSESFGYQEYEAPILESLELYAAKSGEELVKEQAYVFTDRGGEQITLRPELTPSLARMVAQRQKELAFPLRWWSFGPFWRYERPQKGRTREFFQWNVDMIGVNSPEADAEIVSLLVSFFRKVGLKPEQVMVMVNNRRLMDAQFEIFGIPPAIRPAVSTWIDRREKMEPKEWASSGREIGLSELQTGQIIGMLEDRELWKKSEELVRFFAAVEAMGVAEYVRFEPSIVRGLLYYTGTVLEAWEVGGEIKRAILGGGRYDNLLADVGGEPLPGVGFAMGDVVITLILEKYGLLPQNLRVNPAPILVTVFDAAHLLESFRLADELRTSGLNVACYPEVARLPRQFRYADRMGMRLVLVLGPDEKARGSVTIKDLLQGIQVEVARSELEKAIQAMLGERAR
uniref:Histidine--tRNA ligase n=1 Tax=uncultured Chloroflexota bacterium TaxID=166587 RepID=H5SPG2_9CHLR|nr:histidyl-tRNA synthetase [uncultured Chloroflexota bacterium]BAL58048.1 histidyl-tRNA synthetase [uncultured Chloroflexota bacterium]